MGLMDEKRLEARARFLERGARSAAFTKSLPRALNEECGVFGIIGYEADLSEDELCELSDEDLDRKNDAAPIVALGLHALQHRGQESCGIVSTDGEIFYQDRAMGLVGEHFNNRETIEKLVGHSALGHTRYSTSGSSEIKNVQPFYADLDRGGLALAHNGNLTNALTLRAELIRQGRIFQTTSDSEIFVKLIAQSRRLSFADRIAESLLSIEGGYALLTLTGNQLIGVRDPVGIRPLVLGRLGKAPILASESCALDLIGATFEREVEPGEMVICTADGRVESRRCFPEAVQSRPCVFELIYFARPDSIADGKSVYQSRKRLGRKLAEEAPLEADVICPIPDGGVPSAIGFSEASGIAYEMGLIRGHYAGRTFIQPTQAQRENGVSRKHAPNPGVVAGKRVVLIDDSIVRGTTSSVLTNMLRRAGATEVHYRIACPPIKWPDYYGIDMPSREELLAARMSVDEICEHIGADSLAFLSIDGLYEALGKGERDDQSPALTDHCFTGQYPTPLIDKDREGQTAKIEQLSFLKESS